MGNFDISALKKNSNYYFAFIVAILAGIISGIILFKIADLTQFFCGFAKDYIKRVFEFDNGALFLSALFKESCVNAFIFIFGAVFIKLKFLTVAVLFFRAAFASLYCAVMFVYCGFSGVMAGVVVYIPYTLLCFAGGVMIFSSSCFGLRRSALLPVVVTVAEALLLIILVNTVFRVIVVI